MIRLALIGCGGMGGAHRNALPALGGRAQIVATVDIDESRAKATAEALGCEVAVTDYRQIANGIDAAIVALPHHLHHPVGMDLLQRGKHVLMEKPLANSEAECLDLIRAARAGGRTLMTAYCMRYHPLVLEMEKRLRSGEIGDVFQCSLWTEQHTQKPAGHWMHSKATLGGGQLFSHGCHYIDILLAWMGRPVEGTHVGTRFGTPWMEGEGTSNVAIKFEGGALGYHFGTWGARGTRLKYSFHAHGTDAMLEAQIRTGRLILHRDAEEEAAGREKVLYETETGKQVSEELQHFVDCVENGTRPLTDGPRSLQGLRVIWRLYEAEARGVVADLRGLGLDQVTEEGVAEVPADG